MSRAHSHKKDSEKENVKWKVETPGKLQIVTADSKATHRYDAKTGTQRIPTTAHPLGWAVFLFRQAISNLHAVL
jgi:hypothetical protein